MSNPSLPSYKSIEISADEVSSALAPVANFGYYGNLPIGTSWALGPMICHRDSLLIDISNSEAMKREMEKEFGEEGQESGWEITHTSHWAYGWMDHLSFRAVNDDGSASDQFKCIIEMTNSLEDYPVLDDEDYSERCYAAFMDAATDQVERHLNKIEFDQDLDETEQNALTGAILEWMSANKCRSYVRALETIDEPGGGYSIEYDDTCKALDALGYRIVDM